LSSSEVAPGSQNVMRGARVDGAAR
jgi:hypothetical protein